MLNCQLCLKYSRSKKKQDTNLSLGHEIPLFPWTKLATDLFHFKGDSHSLLVDYTSCFPIVRKLKSMTSQHIADHFKQIFAEYASTHLHERKTFTYPYVAVQTIKIPKSSLHVVIITIIINTHFILWENRRQKVNPVDC